MPISAAAIKEKAADAAKLERERVALRHFVLSDLSIRLRNATEAQTMQIAANLGLLTDGKLDFATFPDRMLVREFLTLAITPDVSAFRSIETRKALRNLEDRYGERLFDVPGFYRDTTGKAQLALPKRAGLLFYHDRRGLLAGIAAFPLNERRRFWLLSSKRYGGPKATPMMPETHDFLSRHIDG